MELRVTAHRLFQQSKSGEAQHASREAADTFLGIGLKEHAAHDYVSLAKKETQLSVDDDDEILCLEAMVMLAARMLGVPFPGPHKAEGMPAATPHG